MLSRKHINLKHLSLLTVIIGFMSQAAFANSTEYATEGKIESKRSDHIILDDSAYIVNKSTRIYKKDNKPGRYADLYRGKYIYIKYIPTPRYPMNKFAGTITKIYLYKR